MSLIIFLHLLKQIIVGWSIGAISYSFFTYWSSAFQVHLFAGGVMIILFPFLVSSASLRTELFYGDISLGQSEYIGKTEIKDCLSWGPIRAYSILSPYDILKCWAAPPQARCSTSMHPVADILAVAGFCFDGPSLARVLKLKRLYIWKFWITSCELSSDFYSPGRNDLFPLSVWY